MIEFTCPGCLSQAVANAAFSGMRARCIVCGAFIRIPARSGETAALSGPSPGAAPPAGDFGGPRPPRSLRPRSDGELVVLSERDDASDPDDLGFTADEHEPDAPDSSVSLEELEPDPDAFALEPSEPEQAGGDESGAAEGELDGKLAWDEPEEEEEPPPVEDDRARAAEEEAARKKAKKKRLFMIVGGSVAAALAIVLVVVLSGDKKPTLPAPPGGPTETAKPLPKEPPPKPKEEPPKAKEAAPAPAAPEVRQYTVQQLLAERGANPTSFDKQFDKQPFVLRGFLARTKDGVGYLADGPTDPGIPCVPLLGVGFAPAPEFGPLRTGQGVAVGGVYAPGPRLVGCRVVESGLGADPQYRDKDVEVAGVIASIDGGTGAPGGPGALPSVTLDTFLTDCPVAVKFVFRKSEREKLQLRAPGQPVAIRGRCAGRLFRTVLFDDCLLLEGGDPEIPGVLRVSSAKLVADYEGDMLKAPRPDPLTNPPTQIGADALAGAFGANERAATAKFGNTFVCVTGRVVQRTPGSGQLVMEAGTTHKYQVLLRFIPLKYAQVPELNVPIKVVGVCAGVTAGPQPYVVLENCQYTDPEKPDPMKRITPGYFPFERDREYVFDVLSPGPAAAKEHPIRQVRVKCVEPDLIQTLALRQGTFPKTTFMGEEAAQPKWTKDFTTLPKNVPETSQVRITDAGVETRLRPPPPAVAPPIWEPVLKFGARKDETWSGLTSDGRLVVCKVVSFARDAVGRPTLEVLRVVKNPRDPRWEETLITYKHGVGEVRRVTVQFGGAGTGTVIRETRLVESEPASPKGPKKEPEPTKPDPKDDK
jgi:hypothetical protein